MNNEKKTPSPAIPKRNNASEVLNYSDIIKTEVDFFNFRHWCEENRKYSIEDQLKALENTVISPEMVDEITRFYQGQGDVNRFDRDAIEKFKTSRQKNLFFPGPIHVVEALQKRFHYRTIPEIGTDREPVYYFNGQIYERAEERIKEEAHCEYIRQWREIAHLADKLHNDAYAAQMRSRIDHGPSANDINEVLAMIRRTTFTYEEMNPKSHIPFLNGLLNLETRQLDPFTPELFYTYQINANLLDKYVTLRDTPMFNALLNTAFYEPDIATVLAYFAYTFYPDLPVHKTLFILGRERIGKGTIVRILQGLIAKGSGSISLARLITSDRFQFTGIEGKNLLIDSETKRKFRRGTVLEFSAFCNLFGKDVLSVEPKGHEAHDYVSKAKGVFLGNLPFISVDSPPAIARMLLIVTRDERPKKIIPDLDSKILNSERDLIATLLIQILFKLIDTDFHFPGQMTDESTAELVDKLADPVENFIEEETETDSEGYLPVDDVYSQFMEWCKNKSIPPISKQTFTKKFGHTYPKKRIGSRGKRKYVFVGCLLVSNDLEVKNETLNQVGHGLDDGKNLKIGVSGERYRRVQHEYCNLRVRREENDHDHDVRVSVHKLDTDILLSKKAENKAPANIKSVSNLIQDNDSVQNENQGHTAKVRACKPRTTQGIRREEAGVYGRAKQEIRGRPHDGRGDGKSSKGTRKEQG